MQTTTWIDRISDESNLWLRANKHEGHSEFATAVKLYLRDASDCLARRAPVKGALSCSCAADCLSRVGLHDLARRLYREAGLAYLDGAESARESVREMLWCLREAWVHFQLADDREIAEGVLRRLSVLSRRVDPFSAEPAPMQRPVGEVEHPDEISRAEIADLEREVGQFVDARRSGHYVAHEPGHFTAGHKKGARATANEKSIINQLG